MIHCFCRHATRGLGPRSKSQASELLHSNRVGSEARPRASARRLEHVEMMDSACQTEENGLEVDAWADLDEGPDALPIPEAASTLGGAEAFLNQIMQTQVSP